MNHISIVYFSNTGVTQTLVKSAIEEIKSQGLSVYDYQIKGSSIVEGRFVDVDIFQQLHESQAIIFASPTYMGGVAAQFKAFADATSDFWSKQLWSGKFAAGITCGSAPNGDQTVSLQYLNTLSNQHGMLWVGLDVAHINSHSINPLGSQMGVTVHSVDGEVRKADINTVKYLVGRISNILKDTR